MKELIDAINRLAAAVEGKAKPMPTLTMTSFNLSARLNRYFGKINAMPGSARKKLAGYLSRMAIPLEEFNPATFDWDSVEWTDKQRSLIRSLTKGKQ